MTKVDKFDKNLAYLGSRLWLPKSSVNLRLLRSGMHVRIGGVPEPLWVEKENHIGVPRFYLPRSMTPRVPVIDIRPKSYPRVGIRSLVELDAKDRNKTTQREATKALLDSNGGVLHVRCGAGKALANGEPVLTPNGWVEIEKLTPGSLVAGVDGEFHPVLGVYPQGARDLFRVTFTDGTHVVCDGDHLWAVERRREKGKPASVMTTEEMLAAGLKNKAGRKFFVPMPTPVIGSEQELPLDPYTLGALLGDGHLSEPSRVLFTTMDTEVLDNMVLPARIRPKVLAHQNSGKALTYTLAPPHGVPRKVTRLYNLLDDLGLMGKTSHRKFVPESYLRSNADNRLALLQGLLDTDGSATASAVEFSTASKEIAKAVQYLVCSLGGTAQLSSRHTRCAGKEFPSYRLYLKLPDGVPPFRLRRKAALVNQNRQRAPYRAIDTIEPAGRGEATCIEVASPQRLFLTRGCTPTHNTVIMLHVAAVRGGATLVIVNTLMLMEQWRGEILGLGGKTAKLDIEGEVGTIKGPPEKWNWKQPITIASLATLVRHRNAVTPEMKGWFQTVMYDELHHISAKAYLTTADLFPGDRFGCTATAYRTDGAEGGYLAHIGPIRYEYLEQDVPVSGIFVKSPTTCNLNNSATFSQVCSASGDVHHIKMAAYLGTQESELLLIDRVVRSCRSKDRTALFISKSRDKIQLLHERHPDSAMLHEGVPLKERMENFANRRIAFGTVSMASEALDKSTLDTLVLLEETGNKNILAQTFGRAQRGDSNLESKVIILWHTQIPPLKKNGLKLANWMRRSGYEVKTVT